MSYFTNSRMGNFHSDRRGGRPRNGKCGWGIVRHNRDGLPTQWVGSVPRTRSYEQERGGGPVVMSLPLCPRALQPRMFTSYSVRGARDSACHLFASIRLPPTASVPHWTTTRDQPGLLTLPTPLPMLNEFRGFPMANLLEYPCDMGTERNMAP